MSFPRGFIPSIEEYRDFGPTGWLSTTPLMRGDYVPVYMMGQGPPPPIHEVQQNRFMSGFGGFGAVTPPTMNTGDAFKHLKGMKIIDGTTGNFRRDAAAAVGDILQLPNRWPEAEALLIEIAKPGKSRDPALQFEPPPGGLGGWVSYSYLINETGYLQDLKAWYDNFHGQGGAASAPGAPGAAPSYPEEEDSFPWLPVLGGAAVLAVIVGGIAWKVKSKSPQSNPSLDDILGL